IFYSYNENMETKVNATDFGWGVGMALVAGLVGPFVLWPIEMVLPMPVVVEESYKAWLVWLVLRSRPSKPIFWVIATSLGFGISETMLYLVNFIQSGDWGSWGLRLVTTVPMHVGTMVIQYWGWLGGWGPLGIIPAILGHQWFNSNI
ncbi:MAG TPA: PrsW family glutamic-type intramembrane protease, partial [Anaerolineales bacterium]|nr:PrsW family glutamic-type intramembrane protease [Anaerolineales bacterium]